jgi:ubiquinone/menaquinone biosynthesis C-methylase UbiE
LPANGGKCRISGIRSVSSATSPAAFAMQLLLPKLTQRRARIRRVLLLLVPAIFLCPAAPSARGESPSAPGQYMGREIATTMHYSGAEWLTREKRQREEDCRRLLQELRVKPGDAVCDMGCGNGFYTLKLAQLAVKSGKVYAVDIQQEMLDMLKERTKKARLTNVVPLLGTEADPGLKENSLDLVLMVDVYHEFSRPEAMLKAIRKSLKPSGRIALAEFRAEDPKVPIKPEHKMSKRQILKEFSANGLKLVGQFDKLPWQHLMFFVRDDGGKAARKP